MAPADIVGGFTQLCCEGGDVEGCFVGVEGIELWGVTAAGVEFPDAMAAANDAGSFTGSTGAGLGAAGDDAGTMGADLTAAADDDEAVVAGAGTATPVDAEALAATGALATRSFTILTAESTDDLLPLTYTTRASFAPMDS